MKLSCPHCRAEIKAADVNVAQGVCYCQPCNAVFNLSAFLSEETSVPLVRKPEKTKVESFNDGNSAGYILPRARGIGFFMLFFALIWNGFCWTMFIFALGGEEWQPKLFLLPFLLIGVATAGAAIFCLFSRTSILVDRESIRLERDLFGKSFLKKRPMREILKVYRGEIYRRNERPVYGIWVEFAEGRPLKFGSQLSDAELHWIISEIEHFRRESVSGP